MSYSKRTALPVRACNISWDNLDGPYASCQIFNSQEIYDVVQNCISCIQRKENVGQMRERAKNISQKLQFPVFQYFHFGGDKSGIFGSTPFEVLHTLLLGIMKYTLISLYNYQSLPTRDNPNLSYIFKKVEFEKRIRILSQASKR